MRCCASVHASVYPVCHVPLSLKPIAPWTDPLTVQQSRRHKRRAWDRSSPAVPWSPRTTQRADQRRNTLSVRVVSAGTHFVDRQMVQEGRCVVLSGHASVVKSINNSRRPVHSWATTRSVQLLGRPNTGRRHRLVSANPRVVLTLWWGAKLVKIALAKRASLEDQCARTFMAHERPRVLCGLGL